MKTKLKVFTTFTGIGSQEMALKNIKIDFDIVGISEVDKWALLAYDAIHNNNEYVNIISKEDMLSEFKLKNIGYNFSTNKSEIPKNIIDIKKLYDAHIRNKNYGDIRLIDEKNLPDFDLFTYSAPCKNISVAGKQEGLIEGSNTQSSLLWECKRIISYKKPKYLMMENVKNFISKKHKPELDKFITFLESMGYNNYWKILNAKNFGVPQNRERIIMISILKEYDNNFKFPKSSELSISLKDILEKEVDNKYYINIEKYKHIFNNLPHQDILYCIDQFIKKKKRQLVQIGSLNCKGNESNKRIYSDDGISPTLNSMNGGNRQPKIINTPISKYSKVRKLTPLECWRLMGYKDNDYFKAKNIGLSNTKLYERAGRGIVVPMLEEIFKSLLI